MIGNFLATVTDFVGDVGRSPEGRDQFHAGGFRHVTDVTSPIAHAIDFTCSASDNEGVLHLAAGGSIPSYEEEMKYLNKKLELRRLLRSFNAARGFWDELVGNAPTAEAITTALLFLDDLPADRMLPRIIPDGEDGVVLTWEDYNNGPLIAIEDKKIHVIIRPYTKHAVYKDDISYLGGEIPKDISQHIPIR